MDLVLAVARPAMSARRICNGVPQAVELVLAVARPGTLA
jgi:hypothetical protein